MAEELCHRHGVRNAQVSVLAPTGTISFVMDADTTGIEPEFALVKKKYLAGGGVMTIVNQSVEAGLSRIGWTTDSINNLVGALKDGRVVQRAPDILRCAVAQPGIQALHWSAHLAILSAAQPMVSGGISKTVNLDADVTPEEIAGVYQMAYHMMVKAMAVYRAGSKLSAPLAALHGQGAAALDPHDPAYAPNATRSKLDRRRSSFSSDKIEIDGFSVYLHAGCYPGGQLGELFITAADEGSSLSGLLRTVGVLVSLMLQHAIPLDVVIKALEGGSFLPSGFVRGLEDVRTASSVTDAIAQYLRVRFLQGPVDQRVSDDNLGLSDAARSYHRSVARTRRNTIRPNSLWGRGVAPVVTHRADAQPACPTNSVDQVRAKIWKFDALSRSGRAGYRAGVYASKTLEPHQGLIAGAYAAVGLAGVVSAVTGGLIGDASAAAGGISDASAAAGSIGYLTHSALVPPAPSSMTAPPNSNAGPRGELPGAHAMATTARVTGDMCRKCGNLTLVRTGPCKACSNCGESTGCG